MAETLPLKRLNPAIRPVRYVLNLAIDPDSAEFSGIAEIEVICEAPQSVIELHALGLVFDSVQLLQPAGPRTGTVHQTGSGLIAISFQIPFPAGSNHLRFAYRAPFAKGLEGLYRARNGQTWGAFTQFQASGARRAFPCFDEPGFKAIFSVTLRIPSEYEAVFNEIESHRSESDDTKTIAFATTPPLSTYLLGIAVGEFDIVTHDPIAKSTIDRDPVPLRGIARKGQGKNLAKALEWSGSILQLMEDYFGMAYPFSKLDFVAVADFAAGGMENAGVIMYEESMILIDEDSSFEQYRDVLTTHAHEIAHHWFGNLVSPAWWDDLWLNESFATFMEAKVSNQLQPKWGYDTDLQENAVEAMQLDLLPSVQRIHRPVNTQDEITAAFDAITYNKGGVALAMLEEEMGHEKFRESVQLLLQENRFGTYDTSKFFRAFDLRSTLRANNRSFARLINETGIPEREDTGFILGGTQAASYFRARFTQPQWKRVYEAVPKLERTEAWRAVISLDLALESRELQLEHYLEGVRAFARHPSWGVAGFALDRLSFLIAELPHADGVKQLANELYGPLLQQLGYTPLEHDDQFADWQTITKREHLADFFADTDINPAIELDLLYFGLRLMDDPDELFEAEWLPDEMIQSALTAVVRTRQEDHVEALVTALRGNDTSWQRDRLLTALALDVSPSADQRTKEMLDDVLKADELTDYLSARAEHPAARDSLLDLLATEGPTWLERLGGDADTGIISFADAFTSEHHAQRLESIIRPILGTIQGGEPQLKLTLDRIHLNARILEHLGRQT